MKKDTKKNQTTASDRIVQIADVCRANIKLIVSVLCILVLIIWWIEDDEPVAPPRPAAIVPAVTDFEEHSAPEHAEPALLIAQETIDLTPAAEFLLPDEDTKDASLPIDRSWDTQIKPDTVKPAEPAVQSKSTAQVKAKPIAKPTPEPTDTAPVAVTPVPAVPHYDRAVKLVTQGKYDTAIAAFEQAIEHKEQPLDSHYRLGNLYRFIIGDEEKAAYHLARYLELIEELEQENALADQVLHEQTQQHQQAIDLFQQGLLKAGQDNLKGALADLEAAARLYPNEPLIQYNLATLHHKLGQLKQAVSAYSASVEQDTKNAAAYFGMGMAYQQLNNPVDAITAYKNALSVDARHLGAMNNLAVLYENVGMIDQSVEWYNQIIQVDPQYARAYNNLGTIFARQGQTDLAEQNFLKAIQADEAYLEPHYNLARLYEQSGDTQQALEEYRFIYLRDSSFADAGDQIKQLEQAIAVPAEPIISEPEQTEAVQSAMAEAVPTVTPESGAPNQTTTVAEIFQTPEPHQPAVPETAAPPAKDAVPPVAADTQAEIFDVALEDLKSRVHSNPDSPDPYIAIAEYALEHDYHDIAHEYLEQGITEYPDHLTLRFLLGQTLTEKKFYYRAISEYKQLLEEHPDTVEAYYYLSLLYIEKTNPLRDTRTALQYYRTYNELGGRKPLSFSDSAQTVLFDTGEKQLLDPSFEPASFPENHTDRDEW